MSWPENLPQYKNLASTPNTLNNGSFSWLLLTRMLSHAPGLVSCRSTVRWVGPAEPTVRRYPDQSSNELHPPFLTSISCRDAFCARSMSACQVFNIFYIDDTICLLRNSSCTPASVQSTLSLSIMTKMASILLLQQHRLCWHFVPSQLQG